jgi:hypothetical protein
MDQEKACSFAARNDSILCPESHIAISLCLSMAANTSNAAGFVGIYDLIIALWESGACNWIY